MIDALFNQPNYLAAKRLMDVSATRMEAVRANLANIETPGYRRVDVPESFETELQQAVASRDLGRLQAMKPRTEVDGLAFATRPDGNTVELEGEMTRMFKTATEHALETQLVSAQLLKMRLAITGRSA